MLLESDTDLQEISDQAALWRRDIHRHPELGFEEERTSRLVVERLEAAGVEVHSGIAGTGVVGTLQRGNSHKAMALRADMDALELEERNTFAHRSVHEGRMHACGHDGHTAMLLGAAVRLAKTKNFDGTVHFVFQPAEEGRGGAKRMIEEGLFERFPCDAIYGMHNYPGVPLGHFGIRAGPMMASIDALDIEIQGDGGHGAMPHLTVDPILVAAHVVNLLQSVVSRNVNPIQPAVLSITHISAGAQTYNVIPESAVLKGCIRSLHPSARETVLRRIEDLVHPLCASLGATVSVRLESLFPVLVNHEADVERAAAAARAVVGDEAVRVDCVPTMGSEDFAFMLEQKAGAYILIGNGDGVGDCMVHNPCYDFNDNAIPYGIAYWCRLVEDYLSDASRG